MRLVDESRPSAVWWEDEGRRIAAALDDRTAAVVVAGDGEDAAAVALGIAEVQSKRRRVVVADLTGDLATIQRLVSGTDVHGVSDSFRFGVSLNRIAQRVGEGENLFVLPSGTEPVLDDDIYKNDRWRRLVAGFREVGALLLLATPSSASALADLAAFTDGAIIVGEVAPAAGMTMIASARTQRAERRVESRARRPRTAFPGSEAGPARSGLSIAGGIAVVAAIAFVAAFVLRSPSGDASNPPALALPDSTAIAPARTLDSAAAAVAAELPVVIDPADSAQAAEFSVELARFSTEKGALIRVRDELPASVPGRTFALVPSSADRTLWYRVLAGATRTRASADSLLSTLRGTGVVDDPTVGAVVAVPLAFRLDQDVAVGTSASIVRQYLDKGIPAYALMQDDGSATIYAGAFETAEQAGLLIPSLRAAGIEPTLSYRLGRTF